MPTSEEKELDMTLRQLVGHEERQVREYAELLHRILVRINQRAKDQALFARVPHSIPPRTLRDVEVPLDR